MVSVTILLIIIFNVQVILLINYSINQLINQKLNKSIQLQAQPGKLYRARITMQGTKMFMDVKYSHLQIFDIYNFRVRWAGPFNWDDDTASGWFGN